MNIEIRNGKTLDTSKSVKVYRNLHNSKLSIVQNGIVVSYTDEIYMKYVKFLELVDENEYTLEVGNLIFHNYVDMDGDIKLDIDDVYGDCTYINVYDLDRIINFLTNIKNREFGID